MHFHYNKPSSPSPCLCWVFLRRATPGCSSRSRVSPPGRPHRFHKPSPAQTAPGKSMMSLGHLTKGASWEELIQACLQSFGKSMLTCLGTFSLTGWNIAVKCAAGVSGPRLCNTENFFFFFKVWHLSSAHFNNKIRSTNGREKHQPQFMRSHTAVVSQKSVFPTVFLPFCSKYPTSLGGL